MAEAGRYHNDNGLRHERVKADTGNNRKIAKN